jgi:hypothetical protein
MFGRKLLGLALSLALLLCTSVTAFAGDRPMDKNDLQGISPKRHRLIFSTLGGMAVGMGVGALVGGSKAWVKGGLLGGGAGSAWYLHNHPNAGGAYHDFALIGSHTALGSGLGWTLCDCNDGFGAGALIGGGGTAWWLAAKRDRTQTVGSTQP